MNSSLYTTQDLVPKSPLPYNMYNNDIAVIVVLEDLEGQPTLPRPRSVVSFSSSAI